MTTTPSRAGRRTIILVASSAALAASRFAQADSPGPVTLIVPGPAGGTPDNVARRFAEPLRAQLGQAVVVENRAGASGIIGVRAVAGAAPDGRTLLMGFAQTMAVNLVVFRKLPYDPVADFVPIARLVEFELGLAVPASLPARTVAELIAWLKAHPDKAAFGSFGAGSPSQFAGAMLSRKAGVKAVHVPYKGSAPLVTDLIGGQVPFGFVVPQIVDQHVQGGRLRLLAVTGERRSVNRPSVPTMKELGFDDVVAGGWYGLFAPRGTPAPVIDRLGRAVAAAMKSAELGKALALQDVHPAYQASREFAASQQSEIARWRAVAARTEFTAEE